MKTIALRFGEQFAPACGTITAHQQVIDKIGYVWYGKMGISVSVKVAKECLQNKNPKILLIQSGGINRYWAFISEITRKTPPLNEIPSYYRNSTEKFKTWFKITHFEPASKDIMSKCYVTSSGRVLSEVSRNSMSPYFIIEITA